MYYTGLNPLTGEKVYVAHQPEENRCSGPSCEYKNPANYDIVYKALCLAGRRGIHRLWPEMPYCAAAPSGRTAA